MDIPITEPTPAGFIQRQENGEEYWVQFKFERLADFCYKYGLIDHVTGRCNFKDHARVTMESGVTARLYGPWLRSEDKGSILFVNPEVNADERKELITAVESFSGDKGGLPNNFLIGESSSLDSVTEEAGDTHVGKDDSDVCFKNAIAMLPELEALYATSKRKALIKEADLQAAVLARLRKNDMTIDQIGEWARDLLKIIATASEYENMGFRHFGPEILEWLGTSPAQFSPPTGMNDKLQLVDSITHSKRVAQVDFEREDK